jgi:hypothetical protein
MEEQSIHQLSGREASMMIDRLKSLKERHWKGELWTTPTIQRNRTSSSEGSFAVASAAECGQKKPVPCAERTLAIPCTLKIHGKLPTSQDMPQNTMNQIHVHGFRLQSTASFQEGAPQRENYITDHSFESACASYAKEWRQAYRCAGCRNRECPQCGEQEP